MNWKLTIEAAVKRGFFTKHAKAKAWSWKTCAVGEATNMDSFVRISNDRLSGLGMNFASAVQNDHINAVKKIYEEIQVEAFK